MTNADLTFDRLIGSIEEVHGQLSRQAKLAVNMSLTLRNWLIGAYLVEYEQGGADRAEYGARLVDHVADRLEALTRTSARELRRYRSLYLTYPQIGEALSPELRRRLPAPLRPIWETPSPESHTPGDTLRKSLGDKRKELSEDHIRDLAKLYADFEPSSDHPDVKVFDNADFGFHRITVERPLQLNFQASEERIARLEDERTCQRLVKTKKKGEAGKKEIAAGQAVQDEVRAVLSSMDGSKLYKARPGFEKALKAEAKAQGVTIPGPVHKAILSALSERDDTAEVCLKKGEPEPDSDLGDYENVPLKEDIGEYMDREVLPHVPDAWVDESKTKVGYEIPFTRHFYVYEPPRPLEVIEKEIRGLEQAIQGMLFEVLG